MKIAVTLMVMLTGLSAAATDPATTLRSECAAKAVTDAMAVEGLDGWYFLQAELRHVGAGRFWGEAAAEAAAEHVAADRADPLPAIVSFKEGLETIGVQLLLVPVPPKATIYPDRLSKTFADWDGKTRLDAVHREFYTVLKGKGVEVLDLTPYFLAARKQDAGTPVYCKTDTHWSPRGIAITAELVEKALAGRDWYQGLRRREFYSKSLHLEITGDLVRETNTKEALDLSFVSGDTWPESPVEPDPGSPVILLGDSHTLVFQMGSELHARGCGLADLFALKTGIAVDLLGKMGSGATPARIDLYRRGRRDPFYWKEKKVVVWCFSAREFTEAAWMEVPVVKKDP